jgi:hypothetical protein
MRNKIKRLIKAYKLGGLQGLIEAYKNYPSDWLDDNDL